MFKEIDYKEFDGNAFDLIGNKWMLIVAMKKDGSVNAMTASWGSMGYLWYRPVTTIFVRPQRYTHEFTEDADNYSVCFFSDDKHREMLSYFGKISGRDEDKIKKCGLNVEIVDGTPIIKESDLAIVCKKVYRDVLKADGFLDEKIIDKAYPNSDFHTVYVGEVLKILQK